MRPFRHTHTIVTGGYRVHVMLDTSLDAVGTTSFYTVSDCAHGGNSTWWRDENGALWQRGVRGASNATIERAGE